MNDMPEDQTEQVRRMLAHVINAKPQPREVLEKEYGQVWDTLELGMDFEVEGFLHPMVVCKRKADGQRGSLFFQVFPRYYFWWEDYTGEQAAQTTAVQGEEAA